jgi:hypothetical protein
MVISQITQTTSSRPPAGGWDTNPWLKEGKVMPFDTIAFSSSQRGEVLPYGPEREGDGVFLTKPLINITGKSLKEYIIQ